MKPPRPDWAEYLEGVGRHLTEFGPTEYGEAAPRALLSLPTGRFSYWMLVSGALQADLPSLQPVAAGTRVATWHRDLGRMGDLVPVAADDGRLRIGKTSVDPERWPMLEVPPATPFERGGAKPDRDYKAVLSKIRAAQKDWHVWFAAHCLRPVVIVGTGREHIQRQRETLLAHARHWFPEDVAALIDEDTGATSNPERMLFHPFMVFDAGVGRNRSWLRAMVPRLVIVTSWSSYQRMSPTLFSRSPHVVIVNRRVRSAVAAVDELGSLTSDPTVKGLLAAGRPDGVQVHGFSATAQGDAAAADGDGDGEFDDEELI